jgi:Leucine-rich repeat (LRR) protein
MLNLVITCYLYAFGVIFKFMLLACVALEELSKHPNIKWISMEDNSFTGTLPPSIGNATTLIWLNLWRQNGRGFGGQIPKEIGKLKNLNKLNLAINNFTGEIPNDIGKLVKLSNVDLSGNNFIGEIPKEIGKLENLTFLDLASNDFTGEIPMIELSNLTPKIP